MIKRLILKTLLVCSSISCLVTIEARKPLFRNATLEQITKTHAETPNNAMPQFNNPQPDTNLPANQQVQKPMAPGNKAPTPKNGIKKDDQTEGVLAAAWDGMKSKVAPLPLIIATELVKKGLRNITGNAYLPAPQAPSLKGYLQRLLINMLENAATTAVVFTLADQAFAPEGQTTSFIRGLTTKFTRTLGYYPERSASAIGAIRNAAIRVASNLAVSMIIP